uniref:Uncharacterized protein n=1 Tax=Picea glauca TaxID=3330 RepID=A0A101M4I4_PICGL|nr:hypothetical protein ABT39_MTgene805 [Picea glauca]
MKQLMEENVTIRYEIISLGAMPFFVYSPRPGKKAFLYHWLSSTPISSAF